MSSLTIRALKNSEADYLVRLHFESAGKTVKQLKAGDDCWDPQYKLFRYVAELNCGSHSELSIAGEPVGIASTHEWIWWYEPGRYVLHINVLPAYRRQGIGGKLYDTLCNALRDADPKGRILMCKCREDEPDAERFIRTRGFSLVGTEPGSALDVASFDVTKFVEVLARVRTQGVEIIDHAELVNRMPDWQERCYAMNCLSIVDVPATGTRTLRPLAEYVQRMFAADHFLPEAYFVAVVDGELVGESNLFKEGDDLTDLLTDYTGVIPSHRRRGIATALKVRVIQWAQANGVKTIRTNNHETNPMYQLNLQLGFTPQPGDLLFELKLDD